MSLFIASQNLLKTGMKLPEGAVLRINLAWHKDLVSVRRMIDEYRDRQIFLDIPIGRKKPPNHNHDIDQIAEIVNACANVAYVAISNVEVPGTIQHFVKVFKANLVPKIESYKGIQSCREIIDILQYRPAVIMLDHEDLYSNLVSLGKEDQYLEMVQLLIDACREKHAHLLRVQGIIFSSSD